MRVGTRPQVQGRFTDADGDPVDPGTLTVIVRKPDDTQDTYAYGSNPEVTRAELGVFLFRFPNELTDPGKYYIYFNGGDPADVADEIVLTVRGVRVVVP